MSLGERGNGQAITVCIGVSLPDPAADNGMGEIPGAVQALLRLSRQGICARLFLSIEKTRKDWHGPDPIEHLNSRRDCSARCSWSTCSDCSVQGGETHLQAVLRIYCSRDAY